MNQEEILKNIQESQNLLGKIRYLLIETDINPDYFQIEIDELQMTLDELFHSPSNTIYK